MLLALRARVPRLGSDGPDQAGTRCDHPPLFIGYLVGGFLGAAIATVAIFLPIYLAVVQSGRWFIRHQGSDRLQRFVKGATVQAASSAGPT
ncbi:MAG TPA: chromate transporter [Actinomycetota bacterium]|nr:chromate transporter [Actinomycetota bacterium]